MKNISTHQNFPKISRPKCNCTNQRHFLWVAAVNIHDRAKPVNPVFVMDAKTEKRDLLRRCLDTMHPRDVFPDGCLATRDNIRDKECSGCICCCWISVRSRAIVINIISQTGYSYGSKNNWITKLVTLLKSRLKRLYSIQKLIFKT